MIFETRIPSQAACFTNTILYQSYAEANAKNSRWGDFNGHRCTGSKRGRRENSCCINACNVKELFECFGSKGTSRDQPFSFRVRQLYIQRNSGTNILTAVFIRAFDIRRCFNYLFSFQNTGCLIHLMHLLPLDKPSTYAWPLYAISCWCYAGCL